jgi:hypothetical protein
VAVVSGDVLTVANVGDSYAMLDMAAEVVQLTAGGCRPGLALVAIELQALLLIQQEQGLALVVR